MRTILNIFSARRRGVMFPALWFILSAFPAFARAEFNQASVVLGQADYTSNTAATSQNGLDRPSGLAFDPSENLWVVDTYNNRVLRFSPPFSEGMNADLVLGQSNFTTKTAATTQSGMDTPMGVVVSTTGNVWVADFGNHRVLKFEPPFSDGMNASVVIGQSDYVSASSFPISAASLSGPVGLQFDSLANLYIADANHNRVLKYDAPLSSGMSATSVLVSSNVPTSMTDSQALLNAEGLSSPRHILLDVSDNVWVADYANNRLLRFAPPITDLKSANRVLGQNNFTSNTGATTQSGINGAFGVVVDDNGNLYAADKNNNRILEYLPPFSDGMNANAVMGQGNFTSAAAAATKIGLSGPRQLAIDLQGNLWIADFSNNRILSYSKRVSPDAKDASDNTTEALGEAQSSDISGASPGAVSSDGWYTADVSKTMYFTSFDTSVVSGLDALTTTFIEVKYSVESGYDGTNYIQVSSDNGTSWMNVAQPLLAEEDQVVTLDLFSQGVDTPEELAALDVRFINNDTGGTGAVSFDYIFIKSSRYASPTGVAVSETFLSSATVSWTAVNSDDGYLLEVSTASDFSGTISSSKTTSGTATTLSVLSPSLSINTTYYLRAGALWNSDTTAYANTKIFHTRAVPPATAVTTFTTVGVTSVSFSWDHGINPEGTRYYAVLSQETPLDLQTPNNVFITTEPVGSVPSATLTGLNPGTRYYLFIKALNWANLSTAYTALGSTVTVTKPGVVDAPGVVGQYTALALDASDAPHISYYDASNADLKYAKWTGSVWEFQRVDTAGPFQGISMALDADGNPHISYRDASNADLKYAKWTGSSWNVEVVDAGTVYLYTAIAVDGAGNPHIAYSTGTSASNSKLKYARWTGEAWALSVVDGASGTGNHVSIALDGAGNPHIAVNEEPFASYLSHYKWGGTAWVKNNQIAGGTTGDGTYASIVFSGKDRAYIAYANTSADEVAIIEETSPGVWGTEEIITDGAYHRRWTSLALDGDGNPHIAYSSGTTADTIFELAYTSRTAGTWDFKTLDASVADVGEYASMALDSAGRMHVSYYDDTAFDLKYTSFTGVGVSPAMGGGHGKSRTQAPSNFAMQQVNVTSVTWNWSDNSSSELGFRLYGSETSSGPYTLIVGSATIGAGVNSYTETGLLMGATYFRYVSAVNDGGMVFSNLASTRTRIDPYLPGDVQISAVYTSSITVTWTPTTPPSDLGYLVEASTANDFTGLLSSSKTADGNASSLTVLNPALNPNVTYYLKVGSLWNDGTTNYADAEIQTIATLADEPSTAGNTFTAVYITSMSVAWNRNGNPVDVTTYTVVLSTETPLVETHAGNVSLTTVPAGAPLAAMLTGLVPETTYYFFVQAVNHAGIGTTYAVLGSTLTLDAGPPQEINNLTAFPSGVPHSLKLTWSTPGVGLLGSGSEYRIQYTTDPFTVDWSTANAQVIISTDGVTPGDAVSTTLYNLSPSTRTYYVRIWTGNHVPRWSGLSNPATGFVNPFSFETVDSQVTLGTGTSLALDASGNPHISYYDQTNSDLKYGYWDGAAWNLSVVDDGGIVGRESALALDYANNPHIAYLFHGAGDLKYARWDGASWSTQTVDGAGLVGWYPSIAIDGAGNPHISYYDETNLDLKYARWDGTAWNVETVDSVGGVGKETSIAVDSAGNPYISYHDATNLNLKYARWDGSTWNIETVDNAAFTGWESSIALDGDEYPHISYRNINNLRYARWDGAAWNLETVDGQVSGGRDSSLVLDGLGNPHISYYYWTTGDLRYARWNGVSWSTQTLDSQGDVGSNTSIALDGAGDPHISYFDITNSALKYASWTAAGFSPAMGGGNSKSRPQSPGAFGTSSVFESSITWSWTDNSSNELGFRLYDASSWPYTLIADTNTIGPGVTSFTETGLTSDTGYARYLAAVSAGGAAFSGPKILSTLPVQRETLYLTSSTLTSDAPASSRRLRDQAGGGSDVAAHIDTNGNTTLYWQFRPNQISVNSGGALPTGITQYGWVSQGVAGQSYPASAWTLKLGYKITGAGGEGALHFRISKVAVSGGVFSSVATIQDWTSSGLLVPGNETVNYTSSVLELPAMSFSANQYLMLEVWTKPSAWGGGGAAGKDWELEVGTTDNFLHRSPFLRAALDTAGTVGDATDIALGDAGEVHISYYDNTNADLKYARWDGATWNLETVDAVGDVGAETSIALDSAGNPHISYRDDTNVSDSHLKYAHWDGAAWSTTTVDSVHVGFNNSIAVDGAGNPHISYRDVTNTSLKYAYWDGVVWSTQTVDNTGNVGTNTSIALDHAGNPHISHTDNGAGLRYARWDGAAWNLEAVDSGGGRYTSIALDGDGNPRISYYESTALDLKYARWDGAAWNLETVDSAPTGVIGWYTSIALDGAGNPHISYYDGINGDFKYARWDGSAWILEILDAAGSVGYYSSIALDGAGDPHISYTDITNGDLKYASWTAAGFSPAMGGSNSRPQAPSAFTAGSVNISSVTWTWTDTASNELGFWLYGSEVSSGPFSVIADSATIGADATSFEEIGLSQGSTYYRYLVAVNAGGFAFSNQASTATLIGPDTTPPEDISSLTALQASAANSLTLNWPSPGDDGATGPLQTGSEYRIQYTTDPFTVDWSTANAQVVISTSGVSPGGQVSTTIYNLSPSTRNYYVRIWTADELVNWSGLSNVATGFVSPFSFETVDSAGEVGGNNSIALDSDGNPHISYIEAINNDIKYARWDGTVWNISTVDAEGAIANGNSIAFDGEGNPHITYQDLTNNAVKYARWDGVMWSTQTVGSPGAFLSSLVLDGAGYPHIAYYDFTNKDLEYARWDGTAWNLEIVDSGGDVGWGLSIVLDGAGNPHISYRDDTNTDLKYARWDGAAWNLETVDGAGVDVGSDNSITLDGEGNPHISYRDNTNSALKYAYWDGTSWNIEAFASEGVSDGQESSIVLDGNGYPHISHFNNTPFDQKYAYWNGVAWSTMAADSAGLVGWGSSLALDGDGSPHMSYYQWTDKDLKYASWTAAGFAPAMAGGNTKSRPQAASTFTASAVYETSVTWSWVDNSSNELGFRIYNASWPYTLIAGTDTIGPGVTSFTETGLEADTGYARYAVAVNNGGIGVSGVKRITTVPTQREILYLTTAALSVDFPAVSKQLRGERGAGSDVTSHIDTDGNTTLYWQFKPNSTSVESFASRPDWITQNGWVAHWVAGQSFAASNWRFKMGYKITNTGGQGYLYFKISKVAVSSGVISEVSTIQNWTNSPILAPGNANINYAIRDMMLPALSFAENEYLMLEVLAKPTAWGGGGASGKDWELEVGTGENYLRMIPFKANYVSDAGDYGQYGAIALNQYGVPRISYYDITNGNLKYGVYNDSGFFDKETVDSAGTVGLYTSIAIDNSGNPHISYYDTTNADLKYAQWIGGAWSTATVDSGGTVGQFTSIAVDGAGNPHISYYDQTSTTLKYARWDGAAWITQTVDNGPNVGGYSSIALDGAGKPHISYRGVANFDLKYARWDGSAWNIEVVDNAGHVGWYTSITLDGAGNPHISYYDFDSTALKYARWDGAAWNKETVESAGSVGEYTSIILDGDGNPHISYYDNANTNLKYAGWDGVAWSTYTIDGTDSNGTYSSIALDGAGKWHILYYDATGLNLQYASWTATGFSPAMGGGNAKSRPQAPSAFDATAVFESSITWSWSDTATNESGFRLYGSEVSSGPYTVIADSNTLGADTVSYTETGLAMNATYYRYVVSVNDGGIVFSNQASTPDLFPPQDINTLAAFQASAASSIKLTWNVPAPSGADEYRIQYATDPFTVDWSTANAQVILSTGGTLPGEQVSTILYNLNPSTGNYYVRIWSADAAPNWSGISNGATVFVSPFDFKIVDSEEGQNPAIALDGAGNPHVSYYAGFSLKYARFDGAAWNVETVDNDGKVGDHSSIALDAAGNPHISYQDLTNLNDYNLKYAHFDGVDWSTAMVDGVGVHVGYETSIAVDGAGNPHISYRDVTNLALAYARFDGVAWSTQTVDSAGNTGSQTSMALDSAGNPHISYVLNITKELRYARWDGAAWNLETVETGVGSYSSIAIDGEGNPRISYYDDTALDLKYARWDGAAWNLETLDGAASGVIGWYTSLSLDGDGNPHISYYNKIDDHLKYAHFNGVAWSTWTLDSEGWPGNGSAIVVDGAGDVHIAHRAGVDQDLKYASWTAAGFAPAMGGGNAKSRSQAASAFAASAVSSTTITWSWTDNASNELGFWLYGSDVSSGPFTVIADSDTLNANATSFEETGLSADTTYYRYLISVNAGGIAFSNQASAKTLIEDPSPPIWISPADASGYTLNRRPKVWFKIAATGASRTDAEIQVSTSTGYEVAITTSFKYSAGGGAGWLVTSWSAGATVYFTPSMDLTGQTTTLYLRAATHDGIIWSNWSTDRQVLLRGDWAWTDDPLVVGETLARDVHINELRSVVENVRAFRNVVSTCAFSAPSWTDPTLTPGETLVRAVHINELRTNLTPVVECILGTTPAYSEDPVVAGETLLRAAHISELRTESAKP